MDLYGRDDTIDALWLQQQIAPRAGPGYVWQPSGSSPLTTTSDASAEPAASEKDGDGAPQPIFAGIAIASTSLPLRSNATGQALSRPCPCKLHHLTHALWSAASLSGSRALIYFSGMAAVPQELSAALSEVLRDCNVHETMRLALQQQELLTVEDFAYAFPTLSHLDSLFSNLDAEAKETLAITDAASSVHCARLRRALDRCHAKSALEGRATQPSAALPVQASQAFSVAALQPDSWAEHLPPKLTPEAVEAMRDTFVLHYPGVLLDQDTMPSIRLLSIVHHSLKPGQRIQPMEAKATKPLRTKAQLLSAALFDDTPEMTLQQGAVAAAWLTRVQKPFRNAWALCGAAHLHNLKAFDKKVAELCLQHFDQDLGLRSPNMQELLAADRKIWNLISELYSQNWSLDDALYELTSVRGDLSSLLQPRPRAQKPTRPAAPFKGQGTKPSATQPSKPDDWPENWVTELRGKQLCRVHEPIPSSLHWPKKSQPHQDFMP